MIGLQHASIAYGQKRIFEQLTLRVEKGQCLAILGPNGRGKTSLLRALLGLQPLQAGTRFAPPLVGYVPQSSTTHLSLRCIDMVVMARARQFGLFGQPSRQDYQAAQQALEQVGLARLSAENFKVLSGGERQLVLLARALCTQAPVLILDEPVSALDLYNQERVLNIMQSLNQAQQMAIIFTTHDPNHALSASTETLLMMPNATPILGSTQTLLTPDNLRHLYNTELCRIEFENSDGILKQAILPNWTGRPYFD